MTMTNNHDDHDNYDDDDENDDRTTMITILVQALLRTCVPSVLSKDCSSSACCAQSAQGVPNHHSRKASTCMPPAASGSKAGDCVARSFSSLGNNSIEREWKT